MSRGFHLLTMFDTYLLRKHENGRIFPGQLIGYEPPKNLVPSLDIVREQLGDALLERKYDLVTPTREQFRMAPEKWTRHFDSGGKLPPPILEMKPIASANDRCYHKDDLRDYKHVLKIYEQFLFLEKLVTLLVAGQQMFLCSRCWIDKLRLTVPCLHHEISTYSPSTISRAVHSMKFKLDSATFPAADLLCSNSRAAICKAILELKDGDRSQGAPAITIMLNNSGFDISRRSVGAALDQLRSHALL